jgi:hypothetical protein
MVLSQTPLPGIPVPANSTTASLTNLLAPLGAKMLLSGLKDGVFLEPRKDVGWKPTEEETKQLGYAGKIRKLHSQIRWTTWPSNRYRRAISAMGRIWTQALHRSGHIHRLIVDEVELVEMPEYVRGYLRRLNDAEERGIKLDESSDDPQVKKLVAFWTPQTGEWAEESFLPYWVDAEDPDGNAVLIPTPIGPSCLRIREIKTAGGVARPAAQVLGSYTWYSEAESTALRKEVGREIAKVPPRERTKKKVDGVVNEEPPVVYPASYKGL